MNDTYYSITRKQITSFAKYIAEARLLYDKTRLLDTIPIIFSTFISSMILFLFILFGFVDSPKIIVLYWILMIISAGGLVYCKSRFDKLHLTNYISNAIHDIETCLIETEITELTK